MHFSRLDKFSKTVVIAANTEQVIDGIYSPEMLIMNLYGIIFRIGRNPFQREDIHLV